MEHLITNIIWPQSRLSASYSIHSFIPSRRGHVLLLKRKDSGNSKPCLMARLLLPKEATDDSTLGLTRSWLALLNYTTVLHPNILPLLEADTFVPLRDKSAVAITCSPVMDGNLEEWLSLCQPTMALDQRLRLIHDLFQGLAFLHRNGIIHQNLCPRNILVKKSDATKSGAVWYQAVLSDIATGSSSDVLIKSRGPDARVTKETNVWMAAVIAYHILFGMHPFLPQGSSYESMSLDHILSRLGSPPVAWRAIHSHLSIPPLQPRPLVDPNAPPDQTIHPTLYAHVCAMLNGAIQWIPEDRLTADQLLNSPLFAGFCGNGGGCTRGHIMEYPLPRRSSVMRYAGYRLQIIQALERDVQSGHVQYHVALLALSLYDRMLAQPTKQVHYDSLFPSCYLIAAKMYGLDSCLLAAPSTETKELDMLTIREAEIIQALQGRLFAHEVEKIPFCQVSRIFQHLYKHMLSPAGICKKVGGMSGSASLPSIPSSPPMLDSR